MIFRRNRKYNGFFSTKFGKFVIALIFVALVLPVFRVYLKSRHVNQMSDSVEQELAEMQARKSFLLAEITRLKTKEGKEEEARKKFNIVKPGEEMIIITDKERNGANSKDTEQNLWQKIKNWFKK